MMTVDMMLLDTSKPILSRIPHRDAGAEDDYVVRIYDVRLDAPHTFVAWAEDDKGVLTISSEGVTFLPNRGGAIRYPEAVYIAELPNGYAVRRHPDTHYVVVTDWYENRVCVVLYKDTIKELYEEMASAAERV